MDEKDIIAKAHNFSNYEEYFQQELLKYDQPCFEIEKSIEKALELYTSLNNNITATKSSIPRSCLGQEAESYSDIIESTKKLSKDVDNFLQSAKQLEEHMKAFSSEIIHAYQSKQKSSLSLAEDIECRPSYSTNIALQEMVRNIKINETAEAPEKFDGHIQFNNSQSNGPSLLD